MKTAAILLGDGVEPVEALAPIDILRRGGVNVCLIACQNNDTITTAQNVKLQADINVCDADFAHFDMLVIPGGSGGVEVLKANQRVGEALHAFMEAGKPVGAICAGPTVLNELNLLEGHKATCYPSCEEGFPSDVYTNTIGVVVDNNLITASGPGQALLFGLALLQKLTDTQTAQTVANDMLFGVNVEDLIA